MLKAFSGGTFSRDFTASIVVFLVAMPLCMGIAIASGVPPEKGLITGMIGGLIVGLLAGSPLQVSGPAAGLAVIVFEIVQKQGLSALGPILILAGAIQVIAGLLRVGGWFRAISPAVVHGMLAGIGVLIVVGQFHVLFDDKPLSSGLANLIAMPGQIFGLSNQDAATAFAV
ncbi:SulP family inorganic anion transporter, partial [Sphingobium fuliginis]